MELIFWWALLAWIVAGALYAVIRYRFLRNASLSPTVAPAAHTKRLTNLPAYVASIKKYRLLMQWTAGLLSLCLLTAIILTARPATVSLVTPTARNRDIMLCLDASGSVLREDTTLLDRFSTLVNNFGGQRFGLTLFNSSAVTVIPLNDDYQLITSQLKTYAQAFKVQKGAEFTTLTNGTLAAFNSGTSLASDGLTSCVENMDPNAAHRSESIILATDNEVNGIPIVTMSQAETLAKKYDIHVYVLDPGVSEQALAGDHAQLQTLAKATGGGYYKLSNPDAVSDIIGDISSQPSDTFVGIPEPATSDTPRPFLILATICTIGALALLWRLEL